MKKALLVGINAYPSENRPLRGCVNDVHQMRDVLSRHFAFDTDDVRLLTDKEAAYTTILTQLGWLVADAHAGDVLVFHFSGHGAYVDDNGDDEWDCIDEVLVTQDHDWNRPLRDDAIQHLFKQVPSEVNLTFICDCCHSGTINKEVVPTEQPRTLFVPAAIQERVAAKLARRNAEYKTYVMDEYHGWAKTLSPAELEIKLELLLSQSLNRFKENRFQFVSTEENNILLAGCQDKQTSADALIDGDWHGAFTYFLVRAILDAGDALTYHELITRTGAGLVAYQQIPQLECLDELKGKPIFAPF